VSEESLLGEGGGSRGGREGGGSWGLSSRNPRDGWGEVDEITQHPSPPGNIQTPPFPHQ